MRRFARNSSCSKNVTATADGIHHCRCPTRCVFVFRLDALTDKRLSREQAVNVSVQFLRGMRHSVVHLTGGVRAILLWGLASGRAAEARRFDSGGGVLGSGAPAAKRFCLFLNAPDSFSCNSSWDDTLLCNEGSSKTYLILFSQRYSYSCARKNGVANGGSNPH